MLSIEGLVSNIRNEQEQILAQLIDQTPDTEVEEKSDYYFRLGELYAKQQRLWRLKSAELAIAVDKAKTPQQKAQAPGRSEQGGGARPRTYLLKAVKTYKGLTDNDAFRNYPKMDMALFYYGYTLQGGKYMKEARAVYDKLLKNYPNSKYVPEAHLAFADYYFEQRPARRRRGPLQDGPQVPEVARPTGTRCTRWAGSISTSSASRRRSRRSSRSRSATKNDKKQEVLNRASKKDFVRAYAEIGKADKAFDAFKRVDTSYAFDMLQILADLYLEQGKSDKAIYIVPRADEARRRRTRTSASGSTTSRTRSLSMAGAQQRRQGRRDREPREAVRRAQGQEGAAGGRGAGVPRQRSRDVGRARSRVSLGVGEDQEPRDARVRREALQGLPRGVPRRRGLRADPVLLRRAPVEPRGEREEPAPRDRAVGERGDRVHRRRQDRQGRSRS